MQFQRNNIDYDVQREKFLEMVKSSIDEWMSEKYPAFSHKFQEIAARAILNSERLEKKFNDFEEIQNEKLKKYELEFSKSITEFIQKDYPDIDGRLKICVKEIEHKLKKIEQKLKNTVKSDKLFEDVYNMKDDIDRLRKNLNNIIDGCKKVFGK